MAKVMFFSPNSAIWEHAFPEALVAESLKQGNDVFYVSCGGILDSFCIPMQAAKLSPFSSPKEKEKICQNCKINRDLLKSSFKLNGADLSSLVTKEERERVDNILKTVTVESFLSLSIEGINVGKIALYEFLLEHKKYELKFSDEEFAKFLESLKSALLTLFGAKRVIMREKPEFLLVYNSLYSVNAVFCKVAESLGVICYFIHTGTNLSDRIGKLMIGRDFTWMFFKRLIEKWPQYKELPCSAQQLSGVTDHILELIQGKSALVYSAGKTAQRIDIRGHFGIKSEQKILVASMSSYDERFAVEVVGAFPPDSSLLFAKQVDWIRFLVEFVSHREDLFLVIRVHPREFPNKRDGVKSEHAQELERILVKLPPNIKVDWPENRLSIYDLAQEADLFLNAWSSVGKEMTLLGIPVVIYSPNLILYPEDLNYVGTTIESYIDTINYALREGWKFERIRSAYRWYVMEFYRGILPLVEGFGVASRRRTFWSRGISKLENKFFPLRGRKADCKSLRSLPSFQVVLNKLLSGRHVTPLGLFSPEGGLTPQQEEEALRKEMGRIGSALFSAGESIELTPLHRKWVKAMEQAL